MTQSDILVEVTLIESPLFMQKDGEQIESVFGYIKTIDDRGVWLSIEKRVALCFLPFTFIKAISIT